MKTVKIDLPLDVKIIGNCEDGYYKVGEHYTIVGEFDNEDHPEFRMFLGYDGINEIVILERDIEILSYHEIDSQFA